MKRFLVPYYTAADAVGAEMQQLQECCESNSESITEIEAQVDANTSGISANASDIADSQTDIGYHTSAIVGNTAKIEQNSDAIDDLSAYSMQREPNTNSVDSQKRWLAEERTILDVAGITLSDHGNGGSYADIGFQGYPARFRLFNGPAAAWHSL